MASTGTFLASTTLLPSLLEFLSTNTLTAFTIKSKPLLDLFQPLQGILQMTYTITMSRVLHVDTLPATKTLSQPLRPLTASIGVLRASTSSRTFRKSQDLLRNILSFCEHCHDLFASTSTITASLTLIPKHFCRRVCPKLMMKFTRNLQLLQLLV
jgi:hypothetical protein